MKKQGAMKPGSNPTTGSADPGIRGTATTGYDPMKGGGGETPKMTGETNDWRGFGGDNVSMPKGDTSKRGDS